MAYSIRQANNQVKSLLAQYGIRPNKRLGQNFLTDKKALERILEAAKLSPQDTVVEIGPGLGMLTKALAERVRKVVAIEKDPKMVEVLKQTLRSVDNVEIIQGDVLKHEIRNPTQYKVVANLPYYITSPVIRKFLERETEFPFLETQFPKPQRMVLMVQKEVAQRICAKPPNMSLLAVSVQFYGKPKIVSYVKRTCFWPQPDVDSAILKITPKNAEPDAEPRRFFTLVRAGFRQPRKQLINNLPKGTKFPNGINPTQRAQTLSVADWIHLTKSVIIAT